MKMMEIIKNISNVLWLFVPACTIFIALTIHIRCKQPKIYRIPSQGWLHIKENPIPIDIKEYIASDGKEVSIKYDIKWGPRGEIYYKNNSYSNEFSYITHWQPLPDLPE